MLVSPPILMIAHLRCRYSFLFRTGSVVVELLYGVVPGEILNVIE